MRRVQGGSRFIFMARSEILEFLHSCGARRDVYDLQRVHDFLLSDPRFIGSTFFMNKLVEAYDKCKRLEDARLVFESISERNVFSWTAMITAYAGNGHPEEVLGLLQRMDLEGTPPDKFVFTKVVAACASMLALDEGKLVHERARAAGLGEDAFLQAAVISLYGNCNRVEDAKTVFDSVREMNTVCWTSMITAYARNGEYTMAVELFHKWAEAGLQPDVVTYVSIADSCAGLGDLNQARAIHAKVLKLGLQADEVLASAVLNMFVRCGDVETARSIFNSTSFNSVVPWTAMVRAYAHTGHSLQAFGLFQKMDMEGVLPNEITFVGIFEGFTSASDLPHGKMLHACLEDEEIRLVSSDKARNAVLNMYGRCGSVDNARQVFERMTLKTLVSWTAMLAAYARNGHSKNAVETSRGMDLAGMNKNNVTWITILSACNHGGLLEEGVDYLVSMVSDHGITPASAHYSCVIDLLGKAGRLEEAEMVVRDLIINPDLVVWRTLLGACKLHDDEERGRLAGEFVQKLDPASPAPYVLRSPLI